MHFSSAVYRPTVIVGLFLQQAIALFVLKSGAGFSIFNWIATLASDFLGSAKAGGVFFFDLETWDKHWFFVGVVSASTDLNCDLSPHCRFVAVPNHLLHRVRPNALLPWCYAMGHQQVRLALLQAHERVRCRGCCRRCFSLCRTGRVCLSRSSICRLCVFISINYYRPLTHYIIVMTESELRAYTSQFSLNLSDRFLQT